MALRVLHLIGGGEIGGAEQNIINLLVNYRQEEVLPHLGCLVPNSPFASLSRSLGVNTEIFPMRFPLDLLPLIPLLRYCRKNKIGLIHCHGARANLLGRITARILSIPNVSTVHSLPEFDYPSSWKGKLACFLEQKTLPWSSGLITVSDSLREAAGNWTQGVAGGLPLKTIWNGIPWYDFTEREAMRQDFRKLWGIPARQKVIGTIGRLHPVKGQIHLIKAVETLSREFADLHVLIIGEGPLHQELQDYLTAGGIAHTLTGYLPSAWQALPAMDLFVLPSLSEGMGIVLLEAAQAGIPVVASDIGGIPELFRHEIEALLCPPADSSALADACRRILSDQALAEYLSQKAQQRAKLFTVDRMVKETTAFYLEVVNKSGNMGKGAEARNPL